MVLASCTYQRFCLYTGHVSSIIKDLTKSIIYYLQETHFKYKDVSVSSIAQSCLTLCNHVDCNMPGFLSITNSQILLKLVSIESVMPSKHLILSSPSPTFNLFSIRFPVYSNESALRMRWPKYGSFSFNISPSSEYSGLISFRMD